MSTISSDIIRARTAGLETPAIYPVRGSAKAYGLSIAGESFGDVSLNLAGQIDNGVGIYTVNFTAAMSSASFMSAFAGFANVTRYAQRDTVTNNASSVGIGAWTIAATPARIDTGVSFSIFGNLA